MLMTIALLSTALAGSGPWVVGEGQGTVYVGIESQRLTRLAIIDNGVRDVVDVGEGIVTFGVKAVGTVGLTRRVELQGVLPYYRVQATRPDHPLCLDLGASVGREACETTSSLGVIELRGKVLLVDEFFGGPLSLAVGPELRSGAFTLATRERITNVGEGDLDAGGFVSLGRTGALGEQGYWSAYVELLGRYRFPVRRVFPDSLGGRPVPGPELSAVAEWIVAPSRRVAFGPAASSLLRPLGFDWGEVDLSDPDRFGALRVFHVRVGGTLAVRGPRDVVLTATVLRTVFAQNNPTDVLSISAGLQTVLHPRRGEAAQ